MKLYPDQQAGKNLIIKSMRSGHKRIGFAAPCAYGKTVLMGDMVLGAINKNNRVWIVVDAIELIDQTRETLRDFGIESNVIQGIHDDTDYTGQVQVATAQTLTKRWQYFDANPGWLPDFVMIDEFHIRHKAHDELMAMLPKVHIIGFSATPTSQGLGLKYDDLVVGTTVRKLLEADRLVPVEGYACHTPDMKGIKTSQGDYAIGATEEKINTKTIRGDIITNWLKLGENRKTIVFAVNVKHSLDIASEFAAAGIDTLQIDGRTNKDMRKQWVKDFKNNEYKILVTVGIAIKGFNVVDIGCIIDAQPTKSLSRHIQKIGRGMRKNDVYQDCIILDHAGNLERNGFPEDYEPDELCMKEKGENKDRQVKEKLAKPCPACSYLIPYGVQICPKCGFKREAQAGVETEEGTLKKIKKTPAEKRNKEQSNEEKQAFYSGLLQYAFEKSYKEGWAANQYRKMYNVWPNARDKVRGPVSDIVRKRIQAGNIAWANRR